MFFALSLHYKKNKKSNNNLKQKENESIRIKLEKRRLQF